MALVDYGFTPGLLRDFLIQHIGDNIGYMTYSNGVVDRAVTIGNMSTNDISIVGIEVNLPLFPNVEEVSLIDRDTASIINFWEIGLYLWEDSDAGRLKLYEVLTVLSRRLSGVKIYRCSAGISNGFDYSECYTVVFTQTCTLPKETVNS